VAITRAKKRLFIFDENIELQDTMNGKWGHQRRHIDQFWRNLNLVTFIDKTTISQLSDFDSTQNTQNLPKNLKSQIKKLKQYIGQTDQTEWKKLGIKFFKRSQYTQALRCFVSSGDEGLRFRTEAAQLATQAGEKLRVLGEKDRLSEIGDKKFLTNLEAEMKKQFLQAGEMFLEIKKLKDAARCFFSVKEYLRAVAIFIDLGENGSAGECYFQLGQFWEAKTQFELHNDPWRVVDC
jgi:tetratricopeptide (TPR) repeat protein